MFKIYHWIVIACALLATVIAWQLSRISVQERTQAEFDRQAYSSIKLFEHELNRYADVLRSATGFVAGSDEVLPDEWRSFTKRINFEEQYPALGGFGVVYRVMRDDISAFVEQQRSIRPNFAIRPAYKANSPESNNFVMALSLVAPESLAERMSGFDLAHEKLRLDAIQRAKKTGSVQLTAPVQPDGYEGNGFVIVAPIFNVNAPRTAADRESSFVGVIVGAAVVSDLVKRVLDAAPRQVVLAVSDGDELMYTELTSDNESLDSNPLVVTSKVVSLFGREWRFDIQSNKLFREAQSDFTPVFVLLGGLLFDAMLILYLLQITRSHNRLDEYGKELSRKYKLQSLALEERNDQLETFSRMASHDLKGPLTSIGFLAECIEQDLEGHDLGSDIASEVPLHVKRINGQVVLGKGLIKGILQYSEVGSKAGLLQSRNIDVRELLRSLRQTLGVEDSQIKLEGELPVFETYDSQLTQVFLNLVSNGFKYHHGEGVPVVTVGMADSPLEGFYRFTVTDNGPGINEKYHNKIFEPFSTLQPKDHSQSSGIGLAIVKKLVAEHGGSVEISSEEGHGARFSFDWPRSITVNEGADPSAIGKAA